MTHRTDTGHGVTFLRRVTEANGRQVRARCHCGWKGAWVRLRSTADRHKAKHLAQFPASVVWRDHHAITHGQQGPA